jgi:hypothetical protein
MHHQHPELDVMIARQRYNGYLREAEQDRLAALVRRPARPILRRTAHSFGRALVRAGAQLIRFGRAGIPTTRRSTMIGN